jgi:LacI family transcriptional regulator, repressor for deo operon, udp, cdd, tsx, nupC, and nupG
MAAEHLIGLGHRDIALLGGRRHERFEFQIPLDRREGFLRAMAARDIPVRDDLLVDAEVTMSGGAEAMQALMQLDDRPTAVIAMSDEMAVGAMQVARDYGLRVPADLSIVGFDDHEISEFVGLTTVRQDVDAQGREAATWVVEALDGTGETHHVVLPTRLVVRRSTAEIQS